MDNIVETQRSVAQRYLDDGSIDDACPPIRALLHCMAEGHYQGKDVHHPDIRALFTAMRYWLQIGTKSASPPGKPKMWRCGGGIAAIWKASCASAAARIGAPNWVWRIGWNRRGGWPCKPEAPGIWKHWPAP